MQRATVPYSSSGSTGTAVHIQDNTAKAAARAGINIVMSVQRALICGVIGDGLGTGTCCWPAAGAGERRRVVRKS